MKKPIAVISMYRDDIFFADKWISYYGKIFGYEHIYLFVDGTDQKLPKEASKINCFKIQHLVMRRSVADRYRAKKISEFAKNLYPRYKAVLAMDIDEFLIIDPNLNQSLFDYLNQEFKYSSLSGLGLDVGQHPINENQLDLNKKFLSQRSYALLSDRYTKPVVSLKPINWGSGFHRIKGKNFFIDPNLYLFHFGLIDKKYATSKFSDSKLNKTGWRSHFKRRSKIYNTLENHIPVEGDKLFKKARIYFSKNRKLLAWNKPAPMKMPNLITIPERFQTLV